MHCYTNKEVSKLITVTCSLSKSLDNLTHIKEKGIESWDKEYNVSENYNNAKEFLVIPEIHKMFKNVERVYKEEDWMEKLNEKTN